MKTNSLKWSRLDVLEGLCILEFHIGRLKSSPEELDDTITVLREVVQSTKAAAGMAEE